VIARLFVVAAMGLATVLCFTDCTKQEGTQIETALEQMLACEAGELVGAIEDPVLLLTGCANADVNTLLALAQQLYADAMGSGDDSGASSSTRLESPQAAHYRRVIENLRAYMAAHDAGTQ